MNAVPLESVLGFILKGVWRASWQASILAVLVLVIQSLFTRRLGGRGRYLLWSIVLLRLLLPVVPQSRLSIFNLSLKSGAPDAKDAGDLKSEISNSPLISQPVSFVKEPRPQPSPSVPGEGVGFTERLPRAVLSVWLLGIVVLGIWVLTECLHTSRFVRGLREITDAQVHDIIESCAASYGLRRLPRGLTGEAIHTPAVVGLWRPVLLLPSHVLDRCDRGQIAMIVMHELAHLKRRDISANWVVTLATVIHWFNPLVWLIAARIRADRELACDELVLSRAGSTGCTVQTYGNTLLALAELLSPAPPQRQLVGILEFSAPLERRIRMIARFNPKASGRWAWPAMILVVLAIAFLTDAVDGQGRRSGAPAPMTPATQPAHMPAAGLTDEQVRAQLNHVLPEVRLDKVALGDVMDFMRDVSNANLVVEWRSLENAGIDRNEQVTLRLRNVTVAQALDHILHDVDADLGYHVQSGAIVVSTVNRTPDQHPEEHVPTETVFYDVSDLLPGNGTVQDVDTRMKSLSEAVASTLNSQQGLKLGPGPAVRSFGTKLIITTTSEGQREVQHVLAKLRERPSTQPQGSPL